jgi:hypothetical protein
MSKPYFNWERFQRSVLVRASIDACHAAIFTSGGLAKWFIGSATYSTSDGLPRAHVARVHMGDDYLWKWLDKDLELTGQVLNVTHLSVTFSFGEAGTVTMSARQEADRVRVTIAQEALPDKPYDKEAFVNCYVCWSFFLLNLKSVLEHHIDLREREIDDDELVNR